MRQIRILYVDDSAVYRRLVGEVLADDPALEVVGTAPSGRIGLARIPQVNPDLVLLDVVMDDMDGLQTLAAIRQSYPRLPIIMFSTVTELGAPVTLDALFFGATDYVTKPSQAGGVDAARQVIRDTLIPAIRRLFPEDVEPAVPSGVVAPSPALRLPLPKSGRIEVVVIGASTGGPNVLAAILPGLPADFPAPILVVQHMLPAFSRLLAERLAAKCRLRVAEGISGGALRPGTVWLAPGDWHMTVARDGDSLRMRLHRTPPENSCRPAVDVLFRSAAETCGAGTLGVVLTGMGQDGLRGCQRIREAGGQVLVQDEESATIWGMPGAVARAGLANEVVPLAQLGNAIVRRVKG